MKQVLRIDDNGETSIYFINDRMSFTVSSLPIENPKSTKKLLTINTGTVTSTYGPKLIFVKFKPDITDKKFKNIVDDIYNRILSNIDISIKIDKEGYYI